MNKVAIHPANPANKKATESGGNRRTEITVFLVGLVLGAGYFCYYYLAGLTVAHFDAKAHLFVARRLFDSLTPGYLQMGTHWLPVVHLLYLPFVLVESQYRSGFLPSLLSVLAFGISGWLTFRISRHVTGSREAGFFAFTLFIVNQNILYLQSCPLTEPLYIAFLLLAIDGLLRWRDGEGARLPWFPAAWAASGALCRYEGWYVLAGILLLIAWDWRAGRLRARRALKSGALYVSAFVVPTVVHFGYLYARVHDSFLLRVLHGNPAPFETYKRPLLSLGYHLGELAQIAGLLPLLAGIAGVAYFFMNRSRLTRCVPLFILWLPSLVNISALYWGMIYRVRYSVILLPAIAIFASLPAASEKCARRSLVFCSIMAAMLPWVSWYFPHEWRFHLVYPGPGAPVVPMLAGLLFVAATAWQRNRLPLLVLCVSGMLFPIFAGEDRPILSETLEHRDFELERQTILEHLKHNYDGRKILIDSLKQAPLIYDSGIPLRNFIFHEGNKSAWNRAVSDPKAEAGWICSLRGDEIWERLIVDPHWADGYALVSKTNDLVLYRLMAKDR